MKTLIGAMTGVFTLLLAFSMYVSGRMYDPVSPKDHPAPAPSVHTGPVTGMAGDLPVVLEISPRPVRAMRELLFTVDLPGYGGPAPRIDLEMTGMTMPRNRVDLRRGADGRYRGSGIIVRCPSGTRTWTATARIPGRPAAAFTFDVAD